MKPAGESAVSSIGSAPAAAAWLPARVRPVVGEAFTSLCRRLAEANGVTSSELVNMCRSQYPAAKTPIRAVAGAIGMDAGQLEILTMDSIGKAVRRTNIGWRLRTTVWVCHACSSRGIEDTLRGSAVQFLCLRCNVFLACAEDVTSELHPAEDELIKVQHEILHAMANKNQEQIGERLVRLRRCATPIGMHLVSNEFTAIEPLKNQQQFVLFRAHERWNGSALGLPELPALVGKTLRAAWEISASSHPNYLAANALGDLQLPDYRRWKPFPGCKTSLPSRSAQTGDAAPSAVVAAGTRVRQLMNDGGLRSEHVPTEVRYADDPFLLTHDIWRWRRHVCTQLRLWLINLEIGNDILASYRDGRSIPDVVKRRQRELDAPLDWDELVVPNVTPEEAALFLSQLVRLAERLVQLTPADRADPRVQIIDSTLRSLAPWGAAFASRDIDVARYWMWVDQVAGRDAFGYLPECPPSVVSAFDAALRPEERLALRRYRDEQIGATRSAAAASRTRKPQMKDWWQADSG